MTTRSTDRHAPSLLQAGGTSVVVAGVLTALTHLMFRTAGADFVVTPPGKATITVPPLLAVAAAVFATAIGVALAVVLARRSPHRAARTLLAATVVVLVVAAVNPVLSADQALTVVALEVEHLVVAGAFLGLVLPALRRAQAAHRA